MRNAMYERKSKTKKATSTSKVQLQPTNANAELGGDVRTAHEQLNVPCTSGSERRAICYEAEHRRQKTLTKIQDMLRDSRQKMVLKGTKRHAWVTNEAPKGSTSNATAARTMWL
jgi:hypothetical protein